MDPPERLPGNKALQCLVTEGKFTERKIALAAEVALAQPDNVRGSSLRLARRRGSFQYQRRITSEVIVSSISIGQIAMYLDN
jgi:hypothetical protein